MNRTRTTITALVAVATLTLAGCGGEAGGGESGQDTVRIAAGASLVTDWDDYVADALGFYADNGLTIDRIKTNTASAATQLLVSGGADVSRGLPPMIQANVRSAGGVELVDVADMMIRPPFALHGREGIESFDDLRGQPVAMSSETDSTTIVSLDVFGEQGLTTNDFESVSVGGTSRRFAGLTEGAVRATALLPPVNFKAQRAGFPRISYFPEEMGPDWKFSFTSVVVARDWAEENSDTLVRFLRARHQALQWLADESNRQRAVEILAENIEVPVDEADQIYELMMTGPTRSFTDRIGVDEAAAQRVLDDLTAQGFVPAGHRLDEFVDDSYAARARGEG